MLHNMHISAHFSCTIYKFLPSFLQSSTFFGQLSLQNLHITSALFSCTISIFLPTSLHNLHISAHFICTVPFSWLTFPSQFAFFFCFFLVCTISILLPIFLHNWHISAHLSCTLHNSSYFHCTICIFLLLFSCTISIFLHNFHNSAHFSCSLYFCSLLLHNYISSALIPSQSVYFCPLSCTICIFLLLFPAQFAYFCSLFMHNQLILPTCYCPGNY